jgi:hypothetical protein
MLVTTYDTTACHDTEDHNKTLKHDQHHYMTAQTGAKIRPTKGLQTFSKSQFQLKKPNHKFLLENWFLVYVLAQFKP